MSQHYDKLIIDGNNFLFRAFFVKRPDKIVNGINVTPVHQFLSMLKSVTNRFKPNEIVLTWDKKLNPTKKNFRKEIVAYKEQRVETERTNELFNTISYIQKFVDALGIKTIYPVNMEADDVIRYLSLDCADSVIIVSSDRDLLQLVNNKVSVYLPNKDIIVDDNNFETVANVKKHLFMLYKSILGDVSDNIIGLEKFGPVRAKALAEKIYCEGDNSFIKDTLSEQQVEVINRNLSVVDLSRTESVYPDEYSFYKTQEEEFSGKFDPDALKELFKQYGFVTFLTSFGEWNSLFNQNSLNSDLLSCISM
jgi:5'-3' exonuclease